MTKDSIRQVRCCAELATYYAGQSVLQFKLELERQPQCSTSSRIARSTLCGSSIGTNQVAG